jgi:hypothetical protein
LDDPLNELMAQVVRNGGCVLTWDENGRLVSSETVPFDERSW